ncbi:MAG: EF-P beta-lysylation protein EpmB [Porticoccaceae bacterium]|jgi:EF-P beta-lysylation protein EpmB|nr:EF-P beta-lysylation protein EpmB [Porticoccaceae bacterium]MBT5576966.1 EF-P beta-lysylation protein EpmB [Porticoccaceae bacterium]
MSANIHSQPIQIQANWQAELSQSFTSIDRLLDYLNLDPNQLNISPAAISEFPLRVPRSFAQRMEPGNPLDPLLAQVLPVAAEMQSMPGYSLDPLHEADHNPAPGIVHKYSNRLLLIVSPSCAINCRYCFRRHFPYQENRQSKQQWRQAIDYIAKAKEINEVIFSGGDPLAANDNFLGWLCEQIAAIPHIKRLRIHTRLPVVIPSRIDEGFLRWASSTRLKPLVVLHINHGNEINLQVTEAVQRMTNLGIRVMNQTVLLKGVNDNAETLAQLSEKLFDIGAMPYYLHLLDQVQGASHFDIPQHFAQNIYADLQTRLPGFLVPRLVREVAGEKSKTLIC